MSRIGKASLWCSCIFLFGLFVSACGGTTTAATGGTKVLKVVAAENFYGDIVKQIGGSHVSVTSILSNPNVDPHEYTSDVHTTEAISIADLVIKNGDNYDTWIDKLLSSAPSANRVVLTGADIADHKLTDNPHVWYGVDNVRTISQAIADALKKLDSADAATFKQNLTTFQNLLQPIQQKISDIKTRYAGTPVGLTETIYLYQTEPMGLKMLTPFEFQKAIAEGNDPPADAVATVTDQVNQRRIKVLIYNIQTNTPITTNLQNAAKKLSIPVVPVSETMPPKQNYQSWMLGQLTDLQQALAQTTGK